MAQERNEQELIQAKVNQLQEVLRAEGQEEEMNRAKKMLIHPIHFYSEEDLAWLALANERQIFPTFTNENVSDPMTPSIIHEMKPHETSVAIHSYEATSALPINIPISQTYKYHRGQIIFDGGSQGWENQRRKAKQPYLEMAKQLVSSVPLRGFASSIYYFDGMIYRPLNEQDLKTLILTALKPQVASLGNPQALKAVAEFLLAMAEIRGEPYQGSEFLCLRNGVFDLQTNRIQPLSPQQFFTSFIDVVYTKSEVEKGCPVFNKFLHDVSSGDILMQRRILEMIGYLVVPDMSGKVFFHLKGVGDSGKSVLGNLISSFFNPEAVSSLDVFRFAERFSTSTLVGKRLNCSMDLPRGKLPTVAVAAIKQLTGGDAITVEEKYKPAYSYLSQCKLLFGSNQDMVLSEPDEAFYRREVNIVFRNAIPRDQQDQNLLDKLKSERPAILRLALDAYHQLRSRGYIFSGQNQYLGVQSGNLRMTPISYSEGMCRFLDKCCDLCSNCFTTIEALFIAYRNFCNSWNLPALADRSEFSSQVAMICGPSVMRNQRRVDGAPKRGYIGLKLKEEKGNE